MRSSKGSFSLVFLVGILFLSLFSQIVLLYVKKDYKNTLNYAYNLQQRKLCHSVGKWWLTKAPIEEKLSFEYTLYPGKRKTIIEGTRNFSEDKCFEKLSVGVSSDSLSQNLNYLSFTPTAEIKELGTQHMFISRSSLNGAEYLTDKTLYTSITGSFKLPSIDFLSGLARTNLTMDDVHDYGFSNNIYYLANSLTLTYLTTAKTTKGNELIACKQNITIKKNFNAPGRLILISKGSITIEDNVKLGNVLIITNNNVTLGANCSINGVILANGKITIKGKGTFSHDATAVASFASPFFIV